MRSRGVIYVSYTVTVEPKIGYPVKSITVSNKKEAIKTAKEWAVEVVDLDLGVYIEFFRANDHQKGYINPDGSASISGVSWVSQDQAKPGEFVGQKDIAEMLSWSKQQVSNYYRDGRLPEPDQIVSNRPMWRKSSIEAYRDR